MGSKRGRPKKIISKFYSGKIKPLLCIMSPRDIPWIKDEIDKITFVDKVWFKYTPTNITVKNIMKYFDEHPEYTHLILHADDAAPTPEGIAMLIADAEKYDFDVITGCCCMDKMTEDNFLNLTFNQVAEKLGEPLRRESYHFLPNEFRELNGIIRVWFEGNAVAMMKREIVNKIGLNCWVSRFGTDIRFSFDCYKNNIKKYADLRVYMNHYKFPQDIPPYNIKLDNEPELIIEPATSSVPIAEAGEIIEDIPEKYMKLLDFYYGKPKKINVCLVTEFEQENFFQWHEAFKTFCTAKKRMLNSDICDEFNHIVKVKSVVMNEHTLKLNSFNSEYWNPIREADVVFVYCARQNFNDSWKWFMLPVYVKEIIGESKTKLVVQFDDEFLFLKYKDHIFWNKTDLYDSINLKEFFNETKVLDVADAYFTVLHEPFWGKYTTKPIYYMPLPQLSRYNLNHKIIYEDPHKRKYIVTLIHSVNSASINHLVDNVLSKTDYPVIVINSSRRKIDSKTLLEKLPKGSKYYTKMSMEDYIKILRSSYLAIDDNEGYYGWSRFVEECAICGVPTISSSVSAAEIFPFLKVKHKDYEKQLELINKLIKEENYYRFIRYYGYLHTVNALGDIHLVMDFLKIVLVHLNCKCMVGDFSKENIDKKLFAKKISISNQNVELTEEDFVDFLRLIKHVIPDKPLTSKVFDRNLHAIINLEQWQQVYGLYEDFINDKALFKKCWLKSRKP